MVVKFAAALADAFQRRPVPPSLKTEGAFEQAFAIPAATRVAKQFRAVSLFIHPWGKKSRCGPSCDAASGTGRVLGCPRCWRASKDWATIAVFGTKHTFDMVARDNRGTLAVEIKLVDARRSRMPSGDIQRFLGQCALAAARHDFVVGLCGHRGSLNKELQDDNSSVLRFYRRQNVRIIFRQVP